MIPDLPPDPNIHVLMFEFKLCLALVVIGCSLLLASCSGFRISGEITATNKDGNSIGIKITPAASAKAPVDVGVED